MNAERDGLVGGEFARQRQAETERVGWLGGAVLLVRRNPEPADFAFCAVAAPPLDDNLDRAAVNGRVIVCNADNEAPPSGRRRFFIAGRSGPYGGNDCERYNSITAVNQPAEETQV